MLKMFYIGSLGIIFWILSSFFSLTIETSLIGIGIYGFVMLGMYLFDLMNFDVPKYSIKNYLTVIAINLLMFFIWFLTSWDFWLIVFSILFTAVAILLRTVINIAIYRIKPVTIYGLSLIHI